LISGKEDNLWIAIRAEQSRSIAIHKFYNKVSSQKRQFNYIMPY